MRFRAPAARADGAGGSGGGAVSAEDGVEDLGHGCAAPGTGDAALSGAALGGGRDALGRSGDAALSGGGGGHFAAARGSRGGRGGRGGSGGRPDPTPWMPALPPGRGGHGCGGGWSHGGQVLPESTHVGGVAFRLQALGLVKDSTTALTVATAKLALHPTLPGLFQRLLAAVPAAGSADFAAAAADLVAYKKPLLARRNASQVYRLGLEPEWRNAHAETYPASTLATMGCAEVRALAEGRPNQVLLRTRLVALIRACNYECADCIPYARLAHERNDTGLAEAYGGAPAASVNAPRAGHRAAAAAAEAPGGAAAEEDAEVARIFCDEAGTDACMLCDACAGAYGELARRAAAELSALHSGAAPPDSTAPVLTDDYTAALDPAAVLARAANHLGNVLDHEVRLAAPAADTGTETCADAGAGAAELMCNSFEAGQRQPAWAASTPIATGPAAAAAVRALGAAAATRDGAAVRAAGLAAPFTAAKRVFRAAKGLLSTISVLGFQVFRVLSLESGCLPSSRP